MMILNAGIVIFREYFSSDLPRSRWNYMCNRFLGDKDVKDKEEKGGVVEGPLGYEYLMMVRGDQRKNLQDEHQSSGKSWTGQ